MDAQRQMIKFYENGKMLWDPVNTYLSIDKFNRLVAAVLLFWKNDKIEILDD